MDQFLDKEVYVRISRLLQDAKYFEAEKLCETALKTNPGLHYLPWFYLGVAGQFQGKLEKAFEAFHKAHEIAPDNIEVINACASCCSQLGRHLDAYEALLRAFMLVPENAAVNANLGVALEKLGRMNEALSYYDEALSLEPQNEVALTNRGTLLAKMGRRLEGLEHNLQAYALRPSVFGMLYNLVDALIGVFRYDEALAHCNAALAWMPRHAHMLFKKGMILSAKGQFAEAQKHLSLAQIIQPGILKDFLPTLRNTTVNSNFHVDARVLYLDAMYQQQLCCFWRDRDCYMDFMNKTIHSPDSLYSLVENAEFGFQSFSLRLDAATRLKLAKNIDAHVRDYVWSTGLPPFTFKKHHKKRLKIGYISPDLRKHPLGYLSRQNYGLHDREKFEIFAYSLISISAEDFIYQDIKKSCDVFREVAALGLNELANLIHQDEIDILVDLAGYTTHARPDLIALRPAPIQISYMGYLESMGDSFIDYVVTDVNVYPQGGTNFWHEKAIRLPHHVLPYDNQINNLPNQSKRSAYGLPENAFVFCCFNNGYKIDPVVFNAWCNILNAVPDSVLWLLDKNEHTRANLQSEALKRGIAKERLIFAPFISITEHCLRYQMADLFLDTLWCNAHTIGLETLWQGLPLLTCESSVASGRIAASCLHVLGMPELITQTIEEYERKAIYYAQHPKELKALREKLKSARYSSPLFNTALHVKHLEAAYEMVWQRYEAGLPPAQIDVPELDVCVLDNPNAKKGTMH